MNDFETVKSVLMKQLIPKDIQVNLEVEKYKKLIDGVAMSLTLYDHRIGSGCHYSIWLFDVQGNFLALGHYS